MYTTVRKRNYGPWSSVIGFCAQSIRAVRHAILDHVTPQAILQELWNAEERSAHSFHRSDRASGATYSYEELADIGQEPQGYSASPEDILLSAEETREKANCLQTIFREVEKLPAGQRNIVKGVFVKGASQSDMARELGVSRAAVSKQLSTAVRKIRVVIRGESEVVKNMTTSAVGEGKDW